MQDIDDYFMMEMQNLEDDSEEEEEWKQNMNIWHHSTQRNLMNE
jgi:hypothetical protein